MARQGRTSVEAGGGGGLVDAISRWQLLTAGALTLVALSVGALLVANVTIYGPQVRERVEGISAARAAHTAMLDQQSGLRGYLVTGDEAFLESYQRGSAALPAHNERVESLVGELEAALVLRVRLAQAAWLDGWVDQALALGRAGGDAGPEGDELLVDGKELFDRYRAADAELEARLFRERDRALDQQDDAIARTALLALVLVAVAAVTSLRWATGLRRRLGAAMDEVQEQLLRIRAGDLAPRPRADSARPAEIAEIQEGLDVATAELAANRAELQAQSERASLHNRQLGQVLRFAREVAGSLNLRYVLRGLCTAAGGIAGSERVVVWVRSEDGAVLEAVADSAGPALEPIGVEPLAVGDGIVGRAARFGRIHGRKDAGDDLSGTEAGWDDEDLLAVPMVVGAEVTGVLEVHVPVGTALPGGTVDVLEALAVQAATAVSAARLHERTTVMAMTDPLTVLPNRRRLEDDLTKEVGISDRYERPLAFAMIDVDHFKDYNDALGHQAADVALQALARLLAASVRSGDTVYRYGGEEIAVLMRETDLDAADQVAERLRALVEHHFASPDQPRPVTVSVGVASMPLHARSGPELVQAADQALYDAKRSGRNRVCRAGAHA